MISTVQHKRGVTLLLAVLFLTAGLSISLGIFYTVLVQLQINRSARDSHKAFYAANTIKECAAYYRLRVNDGANGEGGLWKPENTCAGGLSTCVLTATIECNGADVFHDTNIVGASYDEVSVQDHDTAEDDKKHVFKFSINKDNICADVTITSIQHIGADTSEWVSVETQADGFSSCDKKLAVNRSLLECVDTNGSCK